MDEELKKLLKLSTESVKKLTDSLTKKESVGEGNIKSAVNKQRLENTNLLKSIRKTLQDTLKHQIKSDKEREFESKKAKKGKKTKDPESTGALLGNLKNVGKDLKKMGWFKKLLIIVGGILAFSSGTIIGVFQRIFQVFKWFGKIFPAIGRLFVKIAKLLKLDKLFAPVGKAIKSFFGMIKNFFSNISSINFRSCITISYR